MLWHSISFYLFTHFPKPIKSIDILTGGKRNWIRGVKVPGFDARFDQTADQISTTLCLIKACKAGY